MEPALFAEVGNVWRTTVESGEEDFDIKKIPEQLAADWGLGLRVNLDFLLVRLDMGFKVHDPSSEAERHWLGPKD